MININKLKWLLLVPDAYLRSSLLPKYNCGLVRYFCIDRIKPSHSLLLIRFKMLISKSRKFVKKS